ncbi:MAG: hypothetical protein IJY96_04780 [Oscillospiraceae bacterium]|nr:hypothetical protein [Oscillospiraceae bacterium]
MEGIYPVIIGGAVCGKLRVEKSGGYTVFAAECPMQEGVIRLSVYGDGREGYLGVPMPRDGRLCIEKKLSPSALKAFPSEIDHCGIAGEKPEPECQPQQEEKAAEPCAAESADGSRCEEGEKAEQECSADEDGPFWYAAADGALVSRSEGLEMVALPPEDERVPKDIPGAPRIIEGKEYLVYITKEM